MPERGPVRTVEGVQGRKVGTVHGRTDDPASRDTRSRGSAEPKTRRWSPTSRQAIAVALVIGASAVTGAVAASASTLGSSASAATGADDQVTGSCDHDGVR